MCQEIQGALVPIANKCGMLGMPLFMYLRRQFQFVSIIR